MPTRTDIVIDGVTHTPEHARQRREALARMQVAPAPAAPENRFATVEVRTVEGGRAQADD